MKKFKIKMIDVNSKVRTVIVSGEDAKHVDSQLMYPGLKWIEGEEGNSINIANIVEIEKIEEIE